MEGTVRDSSVVSLLTLGAFQDMGWYDVNLLQVFEFSLSVKYICIYISLTCEDSDWNTYVNVSKGLHSALGIPTRMCSGDRKMYSRRGPCR
jgi:hypothetical protein